MSSGMLRRDISCRFIIIIIIIIILLCVRMDAAGCHSTLSKPSLFYKVQTP